MNEATIRLARRGEAGRIADIMQDAVKKTAALPGFEKLFAGNIERSEKFLPFILDGRAFVAVNKWDWPVGFAAVTDMDDEAYLAELAVEMTHQGKGLGRRLVAAACDWARHAGFTSILLSTFKDVPWNAPYYARQGFHILEAAKLSKPGIKRQREQEAEFLDMSARVFMRKPLLYPSPYGGG